jgi:hypothetical protein
MTSANPEIVTMGGVVCPMMSKTEKMEHTVPKMNTAQVDFVRMVNVLNL